MVPSEPCSRVRFRETAATFLRRALGRELATLTPPPTIFSFPSLTETFGQVVRRRCPSGLPCSPIAPVALQDSFVTAKRAYLCAPAMAAMIRPRECSSSRALRARCGANAPAGHARSQLASIFHQASAGLRIARTHATAQIDRASDRGERPVACFAAAFGATLPPPGWK